MHKPTCPKCAHPLVPDGWEYVPSKGSWGRHTCGQCHVELRLASSSLFLILIVQVALLLATVGCVGLLMWPLMPLIDGHEIAVPLLLAALVLIVLTQASLLLLPRFGARYARWVRRWPVAAKSR
jgi:hypothetical protein